MAEWTKEELKKFREMWDDCMPLEDIATELGRSKISLKSKLQTLDFPSRDRKSVYRFNLPTELNYEEEQVVYGSLLGDGTINLQKGTEYNYRECHTRVQRPLLEFKANLLKRWNPKLYDTQSGDSLRTELYTPYHKIWKNIYDEIYESSTKKVVTEYWLNKIDYLGLSMAISDDGGRHGQGCRISTYCFTEEEHTLMCEFFSDKFGVTFEKKYRQSLDHWFLFIPSEDYKILSPNLIAPEGMEYKFDIKENKHVKTKNKINKKTFLLLSQIKDLAKNIENNNSANEIIDNIQQFIDDGTENKELDKE